MKTQTNLINDFKKCPSVHRTGKFFFHSSENKIWIVQNPLSGDWFFEREKFCEVRNKTVSVVSRFYFRTWKQAQRFFLEGNEIAW